MYKRQVYYNASNDFVNKFNLMCGTIRRTLKSASKGTCIKLYKVMALPTLIYGSENWTLMKGQASRIQAAEMRWFLRHMAGYTLPDHRRNTDIRQEYYKYTRQDRPVSGALTAASPNNSGTISWGDGEVWDIRGSAGVTSSNLCLFETGTNHLWFNPCRWLWWK